MAVVLGLCALGSNFLLDLLPVLEVIGQGSVHFGESFRHVLWIGGMHHG
jgi:hypothetical protein